jgi:ABC-2 type transport system permease protein
MTRLVRVEFRRLGSRRMVKIIVAVLAFGVLAAIPLLDWAIAQQARIDHDAEIERCVAAEEPKARDDGFVPPTIPEIVASPSQRQRRCQQAIPPVDPDFRPSDVEDVTTNTAALMILLGFIVGASFIGADWQAGVIPTTLSWESRRTHVYFAKLAAVVVSVFAVALLWHALFDGALTGLSALEGTVGQADSQWLATVTGLALRVSAVSAGAALFGYAAGHLGRSTAGALGLGLGYVFAVENVVGSNFKPLRPWMMFWDANVFVKGQFAAGGDVPGRSTLEAGVVLLAYAFGVTLVALWGFQTRDAA